MKVILHKLFPYAPYLNEYIGFEEDQRDGETNIEAVARLRKDAEQAHRERYPHLYTDGESPVQSFAPPTNQLGVINKEAERIEIAIDNAQTKTDLILLQQDAIKHNLVQQYLSKLKSFQ